MFALTAPDRGLGGTGSERRGDDDALAGPERELVGDALAVAVEAGRQDDLARLAAKRDVALLAREVQGHELALVAGLADVDQAVAVAGRVLGVGADAESLAAPAQGEQGAAVGAAALALLVAVGIGVHNFGEGLAIGTSFAFGELTLGTFLIVGFMIHNVTEGLGIAAPAAESGARVGVRRLAALALIAGAPAILGAWLGGFASSDFLAVVFFAAAAGAALEVVVEVGRYVARRVERGLRSGWVIGGFLAGIVAMYLTGLLAA